MADGRTNPPGTLLLLRDIVDMMRKLGVIPFLGTYMGILVVPNFGGFFSHLDAHIWYITKLASLGGV